MTKFKYFCLLLLITVGAKAAAVEYTPRIDSLLSVLDQVIIDKPKYEKEKRMKIDSLRTRLQVERDLNKKFELLRMLFREYNTFSIDTTMIVALEGRKLANKIGSEDAQWSAMLMEAEGHKGLGQYQWSLNVLDSLPDKAWENINEKILERYSSVYYSLADNSNLGVYSDRYGDSLLHYRQRLLDATSTEIGRVINTIELLKAKNENRDAIVLYKNYMNENPDMGDDQRAVMEYIVAEAYMKVGSQDTAMEYMLQSAISDLRRADRKYNALPAIASMLYEKGDIERSYDYIMCALEDIESSNAYSRLKRVIEALPIISQGYEDYQKQAKRTERILRLVITLFSIVVVFAIIKIYHDNKKLHDERNRLKHRNSELVLINEGNEQTFAQMASDSRTKDDYIGQLFNLCSEYINLMASEHNQIMKVVRTGKMADVESTMARLQAPDRLSSFFDKFDKSFLEIFPDFIEKFNALLKEEYRLTPPPGQLTPELRIAALVRLGITDTTKIAAFLHYSTQTVYNYRSRMRTWSNIDKDDLLDKVRKL